MPQKFLSPTAVTTTVFFSQIEDPAEKEAAKNLFDRILNAPLDSEELRNICDYRTYFHYNILITEKDHFDDKGPPVKL